MNLPAHKVDVLARIGFSARASVYALIGWFGALVALGIGGKLMDSHVALREILKKPFGSLFLFALGLGLFAYAIWRFLQAWRDYDGHGTDAKGLLVRTGYLFGGLIHLMLGFSAINMIFHLARTSESPGGNEKKVAGWVLGIQFGEWLLVAIAIGVFIFAAATIYNAMTGKFARELRLPKKREWLLHVCKFGLVARGIVFAVVGWLFLNAALHSNSNEAAGLGGVWRFLAHLPFSQIIVAVISAGLLAFSIYGFTEATYRRPVK